uniref:Uncharacterized protein n=1 Tax=Meloidogyne enterolobii TaxID=390850 RepID=A0A6V7XIX0_MELEN|nr:unnamed protein product [Meloidogyne enterolobii]
MINNFGSFKVFVDPIWSAGIIYIFITFFDWLETGSIFLRI